MIVKLGTVISEISVRNKQDEDIPVYSVTNDQGFCTGYFSKDVSSKDRTTYKIVPYGCFAYNPSRINVGSVDWQHCENRVIVSPLYVVFKTADALDQRYLLHYLKSDIALTLIRANASGSVRDNLKFSTLKEFPINLRSLDEQKEIADHLDKIDVLVDLYHQQLNSLDELVKSRFLELFGDIVHNDKQWKEHRFSEITSSRLGKMLNVKQQTGKATYPYLANANVQWFRFETRNLNQMEFNEDEKVEFSLVDGDLLVCEGGEIGRCAVWHNQVQPCYFQKALHRVRCNQEVIIPDYLSWWFKFNCDNNGFFAIEGAKATIAHLPGVKLKQLQVATPPISLQNQFAAFAKQVDKSKLAVQQGLQKLETLKKSLMQQYFG